MLRARLPQKENPLNTLLACLAELNCITRPMGSTVPLDQLLANAVLLRGDYPAQVATLVGLRTSIATRIGGG